MVVNKLLFFPLEFPDQFSLKHFKTQHITAVVEETEAKKFLEVLAPHRSSSNGICFTL